MSKSQAKRIAVMQGSEPPIEIEHGVPMPPPARSRPRYPFADMEVGDSFFVAGRPKGLHSRASGIGKKLQRKYTCRVVDGGVRVWRTA